ncbi:MAG TPA: SH3 domain-containing protein [Ferruginibacter sp.]|nr:SH3 domain-containing protein [Ferruginibacter sp.]HMP19874.1 SH3 domain-containing protein [Ferruginibacter sp.]
MIKPALATSVFLLLAVFALKAQQTYYAAAKSGLSVREQPGTGSKVLGKIAYGTQLQLVKDTAALITIATEGFTGYWWKIKYNNRQGYIVSTYVLPAPPPKAGIKTVEQYCKQVAAPYGKPLVLGKNNFVNIEDESTQLTKQLFTNGMEYHQITGYEYMAWLYLLPGFTIEQAYLLLRLLGQYPEIIGANDVFPERSTTTKGEQFEKEIIVERENYNSRPGPVKKISIYHTEAIVTELEIYLLDQQVAIRVSAGV